MFSSTSVRDRGNGRREREVKVSHVAGDLARVAGNDDLEVARIIGLNMVSV